MISRFFGCIYKRVLVIAATSCGKIKSLENLLHREFNVAQVVIHQSKCPVKKFLLPTLHFHNCETLKVSIGT